MANGQSKSVKKSAILAMVENKIYAMQDSGGLEQEETIGTIIDGQEIELNEVRPGEIITSNLINNIIKKLNSLELQSIAFGDLFRLGPLAKDTHTIIVLGGGQNEKEGVEGVWVDGVKKNLNLKPGINLIILDEKLDKKTHTILTSWESVTKYLSDNKVKEEEIIILINIIKLSAKKSFSKNINYNNFIIICNINVDEETKNDLPFIPVLSVFNFPGYHLSAWGIYSLPLTRFLIGGTTGIELELESLSGK